MSPGSTEIIKMELCSEGRLKTPKYYYLSFTTYFAAVMTLYCSHFSSAWMASTQKDLQSLVFWRLPVLSTLHFEQIKGCSLCTSYVHQCKSIRHWSMLADGYQQRLYDVKKCLDLPLNFIPNCFFFFFLIHTLAQLRGDSHLMTP